VLGACTTREEPPTEEVQAVEKAVENVQDEVADLRQEVHEATEEANEYAYSFTRKDEFEEWADLQMKTVDNRLDELDTRVADLDDASMKERWQQTGEELKKRRDTVADKVQEAVNAGSTSWTEASKDAAAAVDELSERVSKALDELESTP
jgi:chromosome segregation ATPase